jgi:hypothetical protein
MIKIGNRKFDFSGKNVGFLKSVEMRLALKNYRP